MNLSPEEFADAVCDSLRINLPAALGAQTVRYADHDAAMGRVVELIAPANEDYYAGGVGAVTRYPTVEVAAPDLTASGFDIAQTDGDVTLNLIVRAFDRHPVHDILYRKMSRLGAAIISVLMTPGAVSDCTIEALRAAWRFNPETEEQDNVVSGVLLAFTVNTVMRRA